MTGPAKLLSKIRATPPPALARRALHETQVQLRNRFDRRADLRRTSYPSVHSAWSPLAHHLHSVPIEIEADAVDGLAGVTANYLEHRFDLLGSGSGPGGYGTMRRARRTSVRGRSEVTVDPDGEWLIAW